MQTALHRASWYGMSTIVRILIGYGARKDIKDYEGVTAVCMLCMYVCMVCMYVMYVCMLCMYACCLCEYVHVCVCVCVFEMW